MKLRAANSYQIGVLCSAPKCIFLLDRTLSVVVRMAVSREKMFPQDLGQEISFHFKYVGKGH